MFTTIANIWKVSDLRNRILFTLLAILIFRIGSFIPVPNVNAKVLTELGDNAFFGMLNAFSGGALQNFSIFAMSITPYITASIIVQLLSMGVVRKFEEWSKEGDAGRKKLAQITRYGTIVLGIVQAIGLSITFDNMSQGQLIVDPGWTTMALIALTLTAGTAFLMWLGEQITEKGIGNGISILIFAGIIAGVFQGATTIYNTWFVDVENYGMSIVKLALLLIGVVLLFAAIVFIQQGVRRIPVQYAKRVVGRKMTGGQSTHIPLKVNAAGVIPVIFASSLLMFPVTIAQWFQGNVVSDWILAELNFGRPLYVAGEVLLIIFFTYFYTFVQVNPTQMSDGMKKNGGFIPGIRPGKPTELFITRVMNRITLAGALFLAAITAMPVVFMSATGLQLYFGGTGLLIVVGVALETMKQVESQLLQRHYKGFIKNR